MGRLCQCIVSGIVCLASAFGLTLAAPLFPNPISLVSGQRSQAIAVGEFNGDGIPDLVVGNLFSNDVSLLIGRGDGTFVELSSYPAFGSASAIVVADFNGDGRQDFAVTIEYPGRVVSYIGNGQGGFFFRSSIGVGEFPSSIAAITLPGSTVVSLVVGNLYTNDIYVVPGVGDGSFLPGLRYVMPAQVRGVSVGDVNDDGYQDIGAVGYDQYGPGSFVSALLGSATGVFSIQPSLLQECAYCTVAVADVNDDGFDDLLASGMEDVVSTGRLWRFISRGEGTFTAAEKTELGIFSPNTVAALDLDDDGTKDIVVLGSSQVAVLLGRGGDEFDPPTQYLLSGNSSSSMATGDFDRDGTTDVAASNDYLGGLPIPPNYISVLLGRGDGGFTSVLSLPSGSVVGAVAAADFDGDGSADLIGGDWVSDSIAFMTNRGDGSFEPARRFPAGSGPVEIAVADFNNDGRQDAAVANRISADLSVLLNDGNGGFGPQRRFPAGVYPFSIVAADFDGNHQADVAVAGFPGPVPGSVSVFPGLGDGRLGTARRFSAGVLPFHVATGDLNRDERPDLVVADQGYPGGGGVYILLNQGAGNFAAAVALPATVGGTYTWVTVADLDADGRLDIAAVDSNRGVVQTFFGNGNGAFPPGVTYDAGPAPSAVVVGDFDGDRRPDLAVTIGPGTGTSVFVQTSFRFFQFSGRYGVTGPPAVADFDLDFRIDLAGGNRPGFGVAFNRGGFPDSDGDGVTDNVDTCTDTDGDGFGDPGFRPNLCAPDNCPAQSNPSQDDADGDLVGDICDACPLDHDNDADHDARCANLDNCPSVTNPGQEDGDHDNVGNVCDNCPSAANSDQSDRDLDRLGDACDPCALDSQNDADHDGACGEVDNCAGLANQDQSDEDGDGRGDACDNCRNAPNPGQEDANGDGSGDACQPALILHEVRQEGTADLVVVVDASDPQGEVLSGEVELSGRGVGTLVLRDPGFQFLNCAMGDSFGGPDGEGIGYVNQSFDGPYLFDLDTVLHCDDGVPDFELALGPCDAPITRFDVVLPLEGVALPAEVCLVDLLPVRSATQMTIVGLDASSLTAITLFDDVVLRRTEFAGWPPPRFDLSGLYPGHSYRLGIRVTDGNTAPVSVSAGFQYGGEAGAVFVGSNRPPRAAITTQPPVECAGPTGASVLLDGSDSSDPDSTPGSNDDIVAFEWFEDYGGATERALGTGRVLTTELALGSHLVTLRVTDSAGESDTDAAVKHVVDTTPPSLVVHSNPATLWPPNHEMAPVGLSWEVSDRCSPLVTVTLLSAGSSEPDDAPGPTDGSTEGDISNADLATPDPLVLLRAERAGPGSGRSYTLTYRAADSDGNATTALALVTVPHDLGHGPEPLILRAEPSSEAGRLRLYWSAVPGAQSYDVVRGDLSRVGVTGDVLHLGTVEVLARGFVETSLVEPSLDSIPPVGAAWFYLIQQRMPAGPAGYGTESAPWPRIPTACGSGCP
ncbi:MAG TPA: VCBS repeat-containing protein [Dongiaceae bacterium]|nr:VCBS repeat-containing protein [Dongiaceae bacterium]